MKRIVLLLPLAICAFACTNPQQEVAKEPAQKMSTVVFPYTASYTSNFSSDVSDSDLLAVLNSYKAWETGDMQMLRASFGDSISFTGWDGTLYTGPTEGLLDKWAVSRDSLSSVELKIGVWDRNHDIDHNADYVGLWYTEIDTYKNGKIDSAEWHDINAVKDGKIRWYAQYRRPFKKK
ncbi:MAG: nuclear transport factor 2 family protein [Cyclobacteriaceae bacterium]|nr:nuclear transport factor 2 family protein [Cyclobacteriaceae bacterium]MDH4295952.1 nuclear transport factor 2 family protein [Cyclobacteriaceae bacterium]MDH5251097.1 nuclear transport factor 2 family protein [Cyclobacteriaceae bacterium]